MSERIIKIIPERVEQMIPVEREFLVLGSYPTYEGEYEITPTEEEQVLETNGLLMLDDVTIHAIPPQYYDMSGEFSIFGLNSKKVGEWSSGKVFLKDTGFNTWTPSTTASVIVPSSAIGTYEADMSRYDYLLLVDFDAHFVYQSGTVMNNVMLRQLSTVAHAITKRAINKQQVDAYTEQYNYSSSMIQSHLSSFIQPNGTEAVSWTLANTIYPTLTQATFSSLSVDNPTITINSYPINARCGNYFAVDKASAIDKNASYYTCDYKLIQVDRRSLTTAMNWKLVERYHS